MTVRMEIEMKGREGRGRNLHTEKVNTKAVKILKVLLVLVIVMPPECEEGRMGWTMGWRGL